MYLYKKLHENWWKLIKIYGKFNEENRFRSIKKISILKLSIKVFNEN